MGTISPKVAVPAGVGALAGAVLTIAMWLVGMAGVEIPAPVVAAFGTVFTVGPGAIAGYLVRHDPLPATEPTPAPAPAAQPAIIIPPAA